MIGNIETWEDFNKRYDSENLKRTSVATHLKDKDGIEVISVTVTPFYAKLRGVESPTGVWFFLRRYRTAMGMKKYGGSGTMYRYEMPYRKEAYDKYIELTKMEEI
jgi:hypothetical protein